jgi:NADH-quinone oxidoreductase subunit M
MTLTLLIFLPLLGAILVGGLPTKSDALLRWITVGVSSVVAALGVWVFVTFDGSQSGAQFTETLNWFRLGDIQVRYQLGVDGLSILLVGLTAILMPLVAFSSAGHIKTRTREFLVWLLVMETGMMGVFLSMDMMLFYFFWEVSLIPLYFILGIWGAEKRIYATLKFFLFTLAGSLLMLVAVIAAVYGAQSTGMAEITDWAAGQPLSLTGWLFAGFAIAFAIKVPVVPFHTWLADAHTQAPTSGSVILAGVLLKMGTYGLLRFGIAMFPEAAISAAPLFMLLGALGILYGAFLAMAQTDVKRLIACSSVSHLGFVVMGMFALTAAGVRGSVLQMVNHGLSTGLLFLLFGALYERRHSRAVDQYGGLAACVPVFAFFWVFSMLASVGLPGLNGFVGEWLILLGTFQANPWIAAVAVTGVIFGAVYLLTVTRKLLFGPVVHEENRALPDLRGGELVVIVPLCLLCLWIGVAPAGFLDKTEGTVSQLMERLDDIRDNPRSAAAPSLDRTFEESAK